MSKVRTVQVNYLARVEGEGGLYVKIKNNAVQDVQLRIFEPPRFFEAFLRGRTFTEAPDITARICGICPVAYQMSSSHAMEDAAGVQVGGQIRELRRLLYCGEWIESHVLHIFMLHAPDFLGYQDAISMAKDHPDLVQKALKFKKIGNELMALVGGREIHPINVRIGGFYRAPAKKEFAPLVEQLKWARDFALESVRLIATFPYPEFVSDYEFVALRHPTEYPICEGRLVSNKGLDIAIDEYEAHFEEQHVAHSNALHSVIKERGNYFAGPLARFNLNFDRLPPVAQQVAREAGLEPPLTNPFKGIAVRAVETMFACEEALRIIAQYEPPEPPAVPVALHGGRGYGCTEAPRGILYHRYDVDEQGLITSAKIVPPTSQNQKTIESDLRRFVGRYVDLADDELQWRCEQAVRNYDPCISCSVHFLNLKVDRE